jgi:hypothetical protein
MFQEQCGRGHHMRCNMADVEKMASSFCNIAEAPLLQTL